ncbi:cold-shock protein [Paenibacillus sp. HJGM_3]|uniref:cold-shock protein n=1 Tax=Paenibacillus sp. HJGM_3 TaxID=3379816 RepID=UPI003859AE52
MHLYYSRKRPFEDLPVEVTAIWSCPNENCKGWMRDNFTFSIAPVCAQCQSEMVKCERMLAALENTSPNQLKQ